MPYTQNGSSASSDIGSYNDVAGNQTNTNSNNYISVHFGDHWHDSISHLIYNQLSPEPTGLIPGVYVIESRCTGGVIDLSGSSPAEGAPITIWQRHYGNNQKWRLALNGTSYTIQNLASGTYLGISSKRASQGSQKATLWKVVPHEAWHGSYEVVLASDSTLVLDLAGGGTANGTEILAFWRQSGEPGQDRLNQAWKFNRVG